MQSTQLQVSNHPSFNSTLGGNWEKGPMISAHMAKKEFDNSSELESQ